MHRFRTEVTPLEQQHLDLLLHKLKARFEWLEREDLRVGRLYLNPKEIAELEKVGLENYDRVNMRQLRELGIRGALWGATVYESDIVPENHVCILQDGLEVTLIDRAACVSLR